MPLTSGTRLGSYEIRDSLGAGGMGEVYRARDTKLHRDVAIKVLPDAFAGDPERLARFEREAHTLAALNHPNIAHIYGLEGSALVMELVDGEDLAARIARGALPLDETLVVARQIAEALEAAHDQGIIHRDLKPANIKIRTDGAVKVLDFGLAKAVADPETSLAHPNGLLPTITSPAAMTHAGIILGTAAYMAPEQARGHAVDKRADIWAFGCVMYEMLTGRRAFGGDNVTDTIAAVVRGEPEWGALPGDAPASVRRLLRRCLQKDRKRRLADAADARLEIEAAQSADADDGRILAVPHQPRRLAVPVVATAVVSLLAGAAVVWLATRSAPPAARVVRLQAALPAQTTLSIGIVGSEVAIAQDGARIVYVGQGAPSSPRLFVRTMDQGETLPIAGTEQATSPFFSPDGEMVAFVRDGSLFRVGVRGGTPTAICAGCAAGFVGGAWAEDDTIVFARAGGGGGLLRLQQDGQISQLTQVDRAAGESRHGFPSLLPGGAVLFTAYRPGTVAADIVVLDPKTGQHRVLVRGGHQPHYVPPGYLVFSTEGALHAVRFDLPRLASVGTPVPVADRVITKGSGGADFAVSRNGSLLYASGDPLRPVDTVAWVDRDGQEEAIRVPPHVYAMVRVSPDGQYAVFDTRDEDFDLWLWDFKRPRMQNLTSQPDADTYPVWSRKENENRLYLSSGPIGERGLFRMDLPRAPERLTKSGRGVNATTITPDGKWLVINALSAAGALTMVSTEAGHEARRLPGTVAGGANADISRDGQWIAYQSAGSGRSEIYVHPFPDTAAFRRQVALGTRPLWSPDGGELFYLDADLTLVSRRVETKPTLSFGNPVKILDNVFAMTPGRSYDISPNGKRFLVLKEPPSALQSIRHLDVVLNWTEDLRRLTESGK